jgi:hypothetical protein
MADTLDDLKGEIDAGFHAANTPLRGLGPVPSSRESRGGPAKPRRELTWTENYLARKRESTRRAFHEVYGKLPRGR